MLVFYLKNIVLSFLATIGFSIVYNTPKNALHLSGICGAVGWIFCVYLKSRGYSAIGSNFFAAIIIGFMGEIFARLDKKPVSVFVIPGIICIVPGYGIYNTMIKLIEEDYRISIKIGLETVFVSGAIATGIVIASSFFKVYSKYKLKKQNR